MPSDHTKPEGSFGFLLAAGSFAGPFRSGVRTVSRSEHLERMESAMSALSVGSTAFVDEEVEQSIEKILAGR